jgi:hypothetical protein
MLDSSYGTKIYEEQERNISSYCHKLIVQRWNTPHVEEGGDPSGGGADGVSPSNLPSL